MDKPKFEEGCWIRSTTIGRGSNGTVSLAVRKSGGSVFAVKSVDATSCLPHQIEALENEIKIHRLLSSPYVVEYLGDGVTAEPQIMRNLYLEYLPGGSVSDLTSRGSGDVDETMIRNFSFSIVSALNYLHGKGIVHCDVKGDNVLVGPCSATAKLADFGSAIIINKNKDTVHSNFGFGDISILPRGSPLWMAPEVIRGEYQGPESDVWSLGCTVIEMITGKPAWEDKGVAETLQRIGYSDELPRLSTQLSELGRDFVRKCLRRELDQRLSCDQLLKHPFLSMPSSTSSSKLPINPSPRSNLDFSKMDDSDEEDEEESVREEFPVQKVGDREEICYSELTERIKTLVSGPAPLWESEGWVAVRNSDKESQRVSISGAGNCSRFEWAKSEYMESIGVEAEIRRESEEFAESIGEECLHSFWGNSQEEKEGENDSANDVVSLCSIRLIWSGDFGTENSQRDIFLRLLLCLLLNIWLHGPPHVTEFLFS